MDLAEVALSGPDEDRVDRLTESTTFDRKQAEAIVRFSKVDRDSRDPDNIRSFVRNGDAEPDDVIDGISADECGDLRRAMDKADRTAPVVEAFPSKHPSTIFRHATGRCEHDAPVDPTTSPRIQSDECREIREAFQDGDDVETICDDFHRSSNAVVRHVFGRCDHDFPNDRGRCELSASTCNRIRRAYRENDTASVEDVARAFLAGASTAHRHLSGACGHRDGDEAPIDGNGSAPIDEDECDRIRARYRAGLSTSELADEFDRDESAVRNHGFGRCRHGGDGCDPKNERVPPKKCKALRFEYKTRGTRSVASILDTADVTKGTLYYHVFGDCSHDVDVEPAERSGD